MMNDTNETTESKRGRGRPQTDRAASFLYLLGRPQEGGPDDGKPHTVRTAATACGLNQTYAYSLAKKHRAAMEAKGDGI